MNFTPDFFNGEIRDGFYVQPLAKRAWAAQLEILEEIDRICARHNIRYVAIYGTLLGAVRHKGFIPWDDDMDIGMLREDYVRFSQYAKQELSEEWRLYDCDNYNTLLTRINNGFGSRLDKEFLTRFHGCPFTVGVDIFPIDHIPDDENDEKKLIYIMGILDLIGRNWSNYESDPKAMESMVQELEEITGQRFDRTKSIPRQMLHLSDKTSAMYWNVKTKNAAVITNMVRFPHNRIPLSCFDNIIRIPFENTTVPVVENYDLMLSKCYGDNYMEPCIFTTHDYPFYIQPLRQIEEFLNERGIAMPESFHIYARKDGKPLVSVIIPCSNAEDSIDQCLASLMCQTISVTSCEIICVENASTDHTADKLNAWKQKLQSVITIVTCEQACTMEEAAALGNEHAAADLIVQLEPTECIEPDCLEKLLQDTAR